MSHTSADGEDQRLWGAVELGGTTIKLALARGSPTNVIEQTAYPTGRDHKAALDIAVKYFEKYKLTALAVGSFGPVDLNEKSPTYGYITSTPKDGWRDVDILTHFRKLNVPLGFSTDVNTAAFGEIQLGQHGKEVESCAYVTIGTGIGIGIVANGAVVTGLLHPEGGHIPVRRHPKDPAEGPGAFKGLCPFHGDCLEGLATANAIAARVGIPITGLAGLPDDHPVWEIESYYLAQLCATLSFLISPHVIILGGGTMNRRIMFPMIRQQTLSLLNGYLRSPRIVDTPDKYIVQSIFDAPGSKTSAGAVGTLAYAKYVWEQQQQGAAAQNKEPKPHPKF